MASALASPPPPWSFGSADLKRNARKFLERALVISALVHLAAVGVFREALERFTATEDVVELAPPRWTDTTFVTPIDPMPPTSPPSASPPDEGEVVPVKKSDMTRTELWGGDVRHPIAPEDGVSNGGGAGNGPDLGPGREEPAKPFQHVDTPPTPKFAPKPPYPDWAREAGIEGTVLLRVIVGADGIPKRIEILRGPNGLKEEAARAVARWTFNPGLSDGQSIEVSVEIPITYRLAN